MAESCIMLYSSMRFDKAHIIFHFGRVNIKEPTGRFVNMLHTF
jgi:hypothetical protein